MTIKIDRRTSAAESGRVAAKAVTYHSYTGPDEQVYSNYLAVASDGTITTLVGTPGMEPVKIQKAGGVDYDSTGPHDVRDPLPDVPADGRWVPADAKDAKDTKEVKV